MNEIAFGRVNVKKMTTEEFAKFILDSPDMSYSFTTRLDNEEAGEWPWYAAACVKLFDVQSVFLNRLTLIGGAPFTFDLPDFELDDDECLAQMTGGLKEFHKIYGEEQDTWYINEGDSGKLEVFYE